MEKPRKSSSTLAVNSILQELLSGSAGSSTAYRKANSEANQGLKSTSQSHSRSKAQIVPKVSVSMFEKELLLRPLTWNVCLPVKVSSSS